MEKYSCRYIGCLQKVYIIKQSLHIAIIGTRGIPNRYGGFEQVAQYLSVGLLNKGHRVTVYNSHDHPYKQKEWKGVQIIHCFDAEKFIGTAGQFIYDLNCIRNAGKQNFDVIVSNPPYIEADDAHLTQGDLRYEPIKALASGVDGLDAIRTIITNAPQHLNPHGWLLLEHGYNQAESVASLLKQAGFTEINQAKDLAGIQRVTLGRLV